MVSTVYVEYGEFLINYELKYFIKRSLIEKFVNKQRKSDRYTQPQQRITESPEVLLYRSTAPGIISLSPLSLATDVTDATLGARGLWLGTRTGAGGTTTLTESFIGRSPWLHGQQVILQKPVGSRIRVMSGVHSLMLRK